LLHGCGEVRLGGGEFGVCHALCLGGGELLAGRYVFPLLHEQLRHDLRGAVVSGHSDRKEAFSGHDMAKGGDLRAGSGLLRQRGGNSQCEERERSA
jgi:hypothetical protein